MTNSTPDISIIIPTYNEQLHLPQLLASLSKQQDISIQIILVDGGSHDETQNISRAFSNTHDCLCLNSTTSRPSQMNLGAEHARSSLLLFLHADTTITDERLLITALQSFKQVRKELNQARIAGHFSMQFSETQGMHPRGFYFYAAKTSLNRSDTINGDQGLMISAEFFDEIGRYDERLHFMEDAKIASKIFESGTWITLPGTIETSARRFIIEGLTERQILNSFLRNFNHIGLDNFFDSIQTAYQTQSQTQQLQLRPFLVTVHKFMLEQGLLQAIFRWYHTGGYVAANAWQLVFKMDCDCHFKLGDPATKVTPQYLKLFDSHCAWFFELSVVKAITGLLTLIWFYGLWFRYRE